jgi:hypothetical protein
VPQAYVNRRNSEGQTPKEIFIKTHAHLQKDGEKWMKNTADKCMIVATLIATVIFAAAFSIPGGSNQQTGTPIFYRRNNSTVFLFDFDSYFFVNSHITLHRRRFLPVITFKVGVWIYNTLYLHGGHDGSLHRNFLFGI